MARLKDAGRVASFTDAWIETVLRRRFNLLSYVASFTDAWIETTGIPGHTDLPSGSHLLQMRGLKPFLGDNHLGIDQVASFTDAWIETCYWCLRRWLLYVASFTDAWIETLTLIWYISPRLVASFTDAWIETNWQNDSDTNFLVASFTDAWIETGHTVTTVNTAMSHLLQMRGLKPNDHLRDYTTRCRIFYRCVD